jgi:predicted acylesterase/phospholipase RssA
MNSPALAISLGASFLGYATHAGFITTLHELGIRPKAISGSSAGALAAALYAAQIPQSQIYEIVTDIRLQRSFITGTPWFTHYIKNTFFQKYLSFFSNKNAILYLDRVFQGKQIENIQHLDFFITASDLETGKTHFITSGSLAQAVVASCAVPTMFTPILHNQILCSDGGIAHEEAVDPWFEQSSIDHILVHRIKSHPKSHPTFFPLNLIEVISKSHSLVSKQLLEYRLQIAALKDKKMDVTYTHQDHPKVLSAPSMQAHFHNGVHTAKIWHQASPYS